jgi:short-subunit dehydrogenase
MMYQNMRWSPSPSHSIHDLADSAPKIKVSVYCPGWVNTELYRIDHSRPERFKKNATLLTDEDRANLRESLSKGSSIEESARILFEGLQNDKLYIGPKAFQNQITNIVDLVRNRAENILNAHNPEHPRQGFRISNDQIRE